MRNIKHLSVLLLLLVISSNAKAQYEAPQLITEQEPTHNEIRINAGHGWVTSEINYYGKRDTWKGFGDYSLDYFHNRKGYMYGVNLSRSHINYNDPICIDYAGASFGYGMTSNKWRAHAIFGIGYAHTNVDEDGLRNGFGMIWHVGADYVFTRHFGIGVELREQKTIYSGQNYNRSLTGFNTLSLVGGLRYYF